MFKYNVLTKIMQDVPLTLTFLTLFNVFHSTILYLTLNFLSLFLLQLQICEIFQDSFHGNHVKQLKHTLINTINIMPQFVIIAPIRNSCPNL